jgi:hypothetical protein
MHGENKAEWVSLAPNVAHCYPLLPACWRASSFRTRMFSSRFRVCCAALFVCFLAGGCEKKDPLAERKFQLLLVDYKVLNRKEIKQTISGKLAEVFSEQEFKNMTEAMAAIGLLPPGYPLREKYIDLLGEQVAAFYDQHTHKLFMYQDATLDNAQNRVILAHELTHALQDQHFGLKRMPLEIKNNDDRAERCERARGRRRHPGDERIHAQKHVPADVQGQHGRLRSHKT